MAGDFKLKPIDKLLATETHGSKGIDWTLLIQFHIFIGGNHFRQSSFVFVDVYR